MNQFDMFSLMSTEDRDKVTPLESHDWKWSFKDYPEKKNGLKVFSCFACGGGSTMGYKLAGCEVLGCCEIDPKMNEIYITNHPDPQFKPPCKNGSPCHVSAPRGARTGTQGLKGSVERSRIPSMFCDHIVDICEETEETK